MLLSRGKVSAALVENLLSWPHSDFYVHQGKRIDSDDKMGRDRVAAYILRTPLSQKMVYLEEKGEVIYRSGKKGGEKKVFSALDWLAPSRPTSPTGASRWSSIMTGIVTRAVGIRRKATQCSSLSRSASARITTELVLDMNQQNRILVITPSMCWTVH